ncbi:hypothetical protein GQ42DRAFT_180183 [Ramicandelaber brevisporus]|nr:hypothetical protein GQ42DRAFT_180183 [Ramicandelaber brevisporus]
MNSYRTRGINSGVSNERQTPSASKSAGAVQQSSNSASSASMSVVAQARQTVRLDRSKGVSLWPDTPAASSSPSLSSSSPHQQQTPSVSSLFPLVLVNGPEPSTPALAICFTTARFYHASTPTLESAAGGNNDAEVDSDAGLGRAILADQRGLLYMLDMGSNICRPITLSPAAAAATVNITSSNRRESLTGIRNNTITIVPSAISSAALACFPNNNDNDDDDDRFGEAGESSMYAIVAYTNSSVALIDVSNNRVLGYTSGGVHTASVHSVAVSEEYRLCITASRCEVAVWDVTVWEAMHILKAEGDFAAILHATICTLIVPDIDDDGNDNGRTYYQPIVVAVFANNTIIAWDALTFDKLWSVTAPPPSTDGFTSSTATHASSSGQNITKFAMSSDGRLLAAGGKTSSVYVWDTAIDAVDTIDAVDVVGDQKHHVLPTKRRQTSTSYESSKSRRLSDTGSNQSQHSNNSSRRERANPSRNHSTSVNRRASAPARDNHSHSQNMSEPHLYHSNRQHHALPTHQFTSSLFADGILSLRFVPDSTFILVLTLTGRLIALDTNSSMVAESKLRRAVSDVDISPCGRFLMVVPMFKSSEIVVMIMSEAFGTWRNIANEKNEQSSQTARRRADADNGDSGSDVVEVSDNEDASAEQQKKKQQNNHHHQQQQQQRMEQVQSPLRRALRSDAMAAQNIQQEQSSTSSSTISNYGRHSKPSITVAKTTAAERLARANTSLPAPSTSSIFRPSAATAAAATAAAFVPIRSTAIQSKIPAKPPPANASSFAAASKTFTTPTTAAAAATASGSAPLPARVLNQSERTQFGKIVREEDELTRRYLDKVPKNVRDAFYR